MEDAKVIPITKDTYFEARTAAPVPSIIEKLEELLAEARDGKVQAFAFAAIDENGFQQYTWRGEAKVSYMIAAVSRLWHNLMTADFNAES